MCYILECIKHAYIFILFTFSLFAEGVNMEARGARGTATTAIHRCLKPELVNFFLATVTHGIYVS